MSDYTNYYKLVKSQNDLVETENDNIIENNTKNNKKAYYLKIQDSFYKNVIFYLFVTYYLLVLILVVLLFISKRFSISMKIFYTIIFVIFPFIIESIDNYVYSIFSFLYSIINGKIFVS
jgi:hypothetical protein